MEPIHPESRVGNRHSPTSPPPHPGTRKRPTGQEEGVTPTGGVPDPSCNETSVTSGGPCLVWSPDSSTTLPKDTGPSTVWISFTHGWHRRVESRSLHGAKVWMVKTPRHHPYSFWCRDLRVFRNLNPNFISLSLVKRKSESKKLTWKRNLSFTSLQTRYLILQGVDKWRLSTTQNQ